MKNAKMVPLEQNRRLPVGGRKSIQESFCVSWWTLYAYQISFVYDKVGGGAAILSLPTSHWPRPLQKNSDSNIFLRAGHVCQIS